MTREVALKILRETHDNALFSVRTALETLIPELAESEDEKIKKDLIEFLERLYAVGGDALFEKWGKADCGSWIAWLEKKPNQSEEEREYVKTLKRLVSNLIRNSGGISDVAYYQRICDWLDGRHIEQKPAEWSEEDEKILHSIKNCVYQCVNSIGTVKKERYIDWLQLLRPQHHWKPTEEQMNKLNIAIACYEGDWGEDNAKPLRELFEQLKKL